MTVYRFRDISVADVADERSACTLDFIAAVYLNNADTALRTCTEQGSGHRLFHLSALWNTAFFPCFIAGLGNVRLFVTKPTANSTAIWVLTGKLFVLLDWQTYRLELAEWTAVESFDTSLFNLVHLPEEFQPLHKLFTHDYLENSLRKFCLATTYINAFDVEF